MILAAAAWSRSGIWWPVQMSQLVVRPCWATQFSGSIGRVREVGELELGLDHLGRARACAAGRRRRWRATGHPRCVGELAVLGHQLVGCRGSRPSLSSQSTLSASRPCMAAQIVRRRRPPRRAASATTSTTPLTCSRPAGVERTHLAAEHAAAAPRTAVSMPGSCTSMREARLAGRSWPRCRGGAASSLPISAKSRAP